jgi:hypothetical protein
MSTEFNKGIVRRYFDELLNQGRLKVAEEILSPEIVFCDPFVTIQGADRLQRFFLMVRKAFPDLHYTAEPGIAEDDTVVSCFTSYALTWESFMASERFKVLRRAAVKCQLEE